MAAAPLYTYSFNWLAPVYDPMNARMLNVQLQAGTYPRGQVLGQVSPAGANDKQTLTGTATTGNFTLTYPGYAYTAPPFGATQTTGSLPWNATAAQVQAAMDTIFGPGNTLVTGGPLGSAGVAISYAGALAATPITPLTVNPGTLAGGTVTNAHTTTGVANSGVFGAYPTVTPAKGFLMYPCTVDAAGNIAISLNVPGLVEPATAMYYAGTFRTEDLVGLDAAAVTALGGVIVIGTIAAGVLRIG
jgi:hypothetical protein